MQVAILLRAGGLRQPAGAAEGIESIGPTISSWDVSEARCMNFDPGTTLVIDRGYIDYEWTRTSQ
jgi:hypothetical protein